MRQLHGWERAIRCLRDPGERKHTSNGRNLPQNELGSKAPRVFAAFNNSGAATKRLSPAPRLGPSLHGETQRQGGEGEQSGAADAAEVLTQGSLPVPTPTAPGTGLKPLDG